MLNQIEQTLGLVPEEAMAHWMGTELTTIVNWRKRGHAIGPLAVKLGTKWFYRLDDLRTYLDTERKGSGRKQMVGEL